MGKIDLNAADVSVLSGLFSAAGKPRAEADKFANRIADWRDTDDLVRLSGAEADTYRKAGLPQTPRNGAFQTQEELKLVMGMTDALFEQLAPAITIYSHRAAINRATAPDLALRAASAGLAKDGETARQPAAATTEPAPTLPMGLNTEAGRAFTVSMEITLEPHTRTRSAVILLTGDKARPYLIAEWK